MCTDKLLCCSVLILYNFIYICSAVLTVIPSVSFFFSFFFAVIIYNCTKGHNISLSRCAPLLLSIFLFSVMNSSVISAKWNEKKKKNNSLPTICHVKAT